MLLSTKRSFRRRLEPMIYIIERLTVKWNILNHSPSFATVADGSVSGAAEVRSSEDETDEDDHQAKAGFARNPRGQKSEDRGRKPEVVRDHAPSLFPDL